MLLLGDKVEACNKAACRILALERSDLIGRSPIDLSPHLQPDGIVSAERWARRIYAARAGQPQWFQWQFKKSGDGPIHVLVHLNAVEGSTEAVNAHVHDLSGMADASWLNEDSKARVRHILDNAKPVIFVKDLAGHYIFVNHELERAVRRPARDVIGRTDHELWRQELADSFRTNDLEVIKQRQAIEFEVTDTYGGQERTYLSFKFPLCDPDGAPYAVCGIAMDISERKEIEDALRNAALAVSSAQGATVFQELARYLAATLKMECAFIAVTLADRPGMMRVLAFLLDGQLKENFDYPIAGTACETVLGQSFRIYPSRLAEIFPSDVDFGTAGLDSYAGYPLNGSGGNPPGLVAVVSRQPMTSAEFIESMLKIFAVRVAAELDRVRGEEALRTSEASYRAIFEASEDAIFIHDWETGAIVDVNPKACEAYGYTQEELKRVTVADLSSGAHPYTIEEAAKYLDQARSGEPVRFEWHRRNRDGSLHWDEAVLKKAVIAGKPRIVAFTREITERKHSEEALRASEEHYRAIFNASADGLLLRDADFRVVDVNPAFLAMTGYTREEVMGARHVITMPVQDAERARELQRRAIAGEDVHIEGKGVRKDGKHYDCEVDLAAMQYQGRPHVLGIVRDISARKQAEARREQLEAQLRQAQKMEAIGQLTGGIAHDFNNLLTSIMGYVVLATEREAGHGDARLAKYLEQAHLSCVRARDLIQQMLTFSRGQRGEPRPLSLPPFVKESVKLLRSSLPATVEIETDLGGEIPAVLLDPVQLDQILLNLCINARDAMGGIGAIRVAAHPLRTKELVCASCRQIVAGNFVELSVADSGPGITPAVLDRMFEPFYTTKEVGKGSGMGLSTVHGIVHEHGGHVIVDTAPERGATFRVLFRPLQSEGDVVAPAEAQRRGAAPRQSLRGHVMVVDDEESVAEFMRDLLESWELEVTAVTSALDAQRLFERDPARFDLVITDQTMPRMTGIDLAREMLATRPDLPVILYSGFGEGIAQEQTLAAGIRALVKKPVEPQALFNLLKAHMRQARR
ncbi:MAG: PAS domain-containing hybrid sensor histidine kinase/response regulator [Betaproteobacteria bacterium]